MTSNESMTGTTAPTGTATEGTATDTTDGVTATTGDDLCEGGTLCEQPASCCPAGNECLADNCLPVCDSGVYCGPALECCAGGQVCSGAECVTPGAPCMDSYDCEPGQYCEQTLGQCLPQPDPLTCELVPEFDTLNAKPEWSWTEEEIFSSPAVADLDGDGVPEVVVNLTCERCRLTPEECGERVAPPRIYLQEQEREAQARALAELLESPRG